MPKSARYDFAPDPPDAFVDITDVSRLTGLFGPRAPRLRSRRGAVNTAVYAPGVGLTVAGAWLAFS